MAGLPAADALSAALANRIDDTDPLVVGRVLHFFTQFPRAQGVDVLVAHAENALDRVAVGYPAPEHYTSPTLWDVLIARLEQRTEAQEPLDGRVADLFRRVVLVPLASLPHEDLGSTDRVAIKREEMRQQGWDVDGESAKRTLAEYALADKAERTDVVVNALERFSPAFNDEERRLWIAEHIVAIDAAAKGRWRPLMNMLTDWYRKPELGYLIVVAGVSLLQSGTVDADEFRQWMRERRSYGWVDDAWVLPLDDVCDKQSQELSPLGK